MHLNREDPPNSARRIDQQKSKAKKRYVAPRFAVLESEQAKRELAARALPGDEGAERMLKLIAEQA